MNDMKYTPVCIIQLPFLVFPKEIYLQKVNFIPLKNKETLISVCEILSWLCGI